MKQRVVYRINFNAFFLLILLYDFCGCQNSQSSYVIQNLKILKNSVVKQMSFYRHNFIFDTCHQTYPIQHKSESLECLNASIMMFINEENIKNLCSAKKDLKLPPRILICLYRFKDAIFTASKLLSKFVCGLFFWARHLLYIILLK